jgi:hypothetical protein
VVLSEVEERQTEMKLTCLAVSAMIKNNSCNNYYSDNHNKNRDVINSVDNNIIKYDKPFEEHRQRNN